MNHIYNINPGIVAEWISLIDPQMAADPDCEEKIAAILKSQVELLLEGSMTEIRARHWVLTRRQDEKGVHVEFSLIAYQAAAHFMAGNNEEEFYLKTLRRLKKNLEKAIEKEDYLKAARLRDRLNALEKNGPAAA